MLGSEVLIFAFGYLFSVKLDFFEKGKFKIRQFRQPISRMGKSHSLITSGLVGLVPMIQSFIVGYAKERYLSLVFGEGAGKFIRGQNRKCNKQGVVKRVRVRELKYVFI